jgi:hypothetical protein
VSAKSFENERFCYCSENKNKTTHKETYWLTKPVCGKFVDMTEKPLPMVIIKADVSMPNNKRQPRLRGTVDERKRRY